MQSLDNKIRRPASSRLCVSLWRGVVVGKIDMHDSVAPLRQLTTQFDLKRMAAKFVYQNSHEERHPSYRLRSQGCRSVEANLTARELRERYDYVIFDTPPVLSVTDPLIVATLADGMVLVIRQGYCTRAMLLRAAEIFREVEVKVYGFVLNGVDASLPEYYGYLGYYSYDYKN